MKFAGSRQLEWPNISCRERWREPGKTSIRQLIKHHMVEYCGEWTRTIDRCKSRKNCGKIINNASDSWHDDINTDRKQDIDTYVRIRGRLINHDVHCTTSERRGRQHHNAEEADKRKHYYSSTCLGRPLS